MKTYINATPKAGQEFYSNFHKKEKIVVLNLLKFKAIADYKNSAIIKPKKEITGEEAFNLYLKNIEPLLKKHGSEIIFKVNTNSFLIGPENEKWDLIVLVTHQSALKFIEFSKNKDFLKYAAHRTAAIEDSRLLPAF